MSCFQLARAPEGRCKQACCLYNRVLLAVLISEMTQTFIGYVLLLRMMKTEDRHSVWFCSSCNGMADNALLFVEYSGWIGLYVWRETLEQGGY